MKAARLQSVIEPLLVVRNALRTEYDRMDAAMRPLAEADPACRRLMTAPGIGPMVALTYRCVIDIPGRFRQSRTVGAHLGLTPVTRQSGETDRRGRISCRGDKDARTALFIAAAVVMNPHTRPSELQVWGKRIAEKRGKMKAMVAVARKLSVILHRMWIEETDYRCPKRAT